MSLLTTTNSPIPQNDYVVASSTAQGLAYDNLLGQVMMFRDQNTSSAGLVYNSEGVREGRFVKNNSGSAILAGAALNFMSGQFNKQVQACPIGSAIRLFAPGYIRGSNANTIPDQAYFFAVKNGPTPSLSDGTAIAAGDQIVVGNAAGKVRTNYGLGGGLVFANVVPSTTVTNTTVATKFDQSYTFPANSLNAGDTIRVVSQVIAPTTNSTDTLTLELMLGSVVVGTTGAIDVANNDVGIFMADIIIRTAGASGTMVAGGQQSLGTATAGTVKGFTLASTAIDTTATQQLAIRATWSVASANDIARLDVLDIARLNTSAPAIGGGIATAAAALGSPVQFYIQANCNW